MCDDDVAALVVDNGSGMCPASFLLFITVPDCTRYEKFFVITFIMSVVWIGILSYLAVWMVTIIGFTFSIPDSVSGLTILAAGTSVPEVMSSIIVARGGQGNMAISNLIGSNTFDLSFCLGAPWLAKALMSETGSLYIYSSGLTYTTIMLLLTMIVFVFVLCVAKWRLNKAVGFTYLVLFAIFVTFACLYEFNVFGTLNVAPCVT